MVKLLIHNLVIWDAALAVRIFQLNSRRWVDVLMYLASRSGDGYWYGLFVMVLALFDMSSALQILPTGLVAFAIALAAQKVLKAVIRRDRPCRAINLITSRVHPPDQFSFPSGHSASAFLMATLISGLWPVTTMPLFLWATLVALSRVYNGVHYPTDVMVGAILGVASVLACQPMF